MLSNAQDTVVVESAKTEQQIVLFPGITLFFEMRDQYDKVDTSAAIFTERNLELMRSAQLLIEKDPNYADFCLRCPVDKSRGCEHAEDSVDAATALVAALANVTSSDVDGAATVAAQRTAALCNEVKQACPIAKCAASVVDSVKSNKHLTSALSDLQETSQSCILSGSAQTKAGVCAKPPGCDDAKDSPLCQRPYSPLNYVTADHPYARARFHFCPSFNSLVPVEGLAINVLGGFTPTLNSCAHSFSTTMASSSTLRTAGRALTARSTCLSRASSPRASRGTQVRINPDLVNPACYLL